ncbi:MAG TPA: tripartite tricarboxylate transporter substrate binding protein [Burkholderiaceae bacterium]|jgi:tripartite-type tricarboxylate transporter receptor subunit TctC|nr:tripartite tricarboxylate transporter substrate binding protein [Burkholderiaceae bacterium]
MLALAAGLVAAPSLMAQGEGFPQRPITLWVPWPAGGSTDLSLRVLAEIAGRHLGQRIVIENRAGAGGTLAMPILQQAAPDGYTIAQLPQTIFRAPYTQKVGWDPIRDVTPIIQISGYTFGIVVGARSPFRTLDDLFAFAREHPGELTIGTNGIGTTPHVVLEELFTMRGLRYLHVPYKGVAEQMLAVASGQLMAGASTTGFGPYVDSGKLRLLVTFGDRRTRRWPQVPTLRELGFPIVAMSPYGIGGPRGLPTAIVTALHDALKRALFDPLHLAELEKYDLEPAYLGPAEYARACREAFAQERRVVERMGLLRTES